MSADNWTHCPNCEKVETAARETQRANVTASYGKVSAAEYLRALNALAEREKVPFEESLREDYEIGIRDGDFSVSYSSVCTTCDFSYSYKYEAVPPTTGERKAVPKEPRRVAGRSRR